MTTAATPTEHAAAIKVRGLQRGFRRKTVFDRLDLDVEVGSVYALLGRNGVGKSTLARCLLGLIPFDGGDVRVLGRDPWAQRHELMREVGFALESPNVPQAMRLADWLTLHQLLRPRFDQSRCLELLDSWQLEARRAFGTLSRGQRTRLCLQVALAQEPQLLILDDPTIGLDPLARREVYSDLIDALSSRELTILLTSHDTVAIEGLATHVGILAGGSLVLDEELERLKLRFRRIRSPGGTQTWPSGSRPPEPLYAEHRHGWGCEWITGGYRDDLDLPSGFEVDEVSLEEIFAVVHDSPEPEDDQVVAHVA